MGIEYAEKKKGNRITLLAYENQNEAGEISALTDGHEWALISEVTADRQEIRKDLIRKLVSRLSGQEIFVTAQKEDLDLYEGLGFFRSKNAFTYTGKELTGEQENELTDSGVFLPLGFRYETEFEPFAGDFPVGKKSAKQNVTVTYRNNSDSADFEQVNSLLEAAFGGERELEVTKDAFLTSAYVQYAYDRERLIGCARAVSDGEHALILNVAVDPDYQGLSIGWHVIKGLADQMEGQTLFLNTHPGGVGFYNRKGFRRNKTALLYPAHQMPWEIKRGFCLPAGYRFPDEMQA